MRNSVRFGLRSMVAILLACAIQPGCATPDSGPSGSGGTASSTAKGGSGGSGGSAGAGGSSAPQGGGGRGGSGGTPTTASGVGGSAPQGGQKTGGAGGAAGGAGGSAIVARGGAGGAAGKGGSGSGGVSGSGGSTSASGVVDPLAGDVKFSTPSQTFKDQIQTEMSTSISGAEIRYTVDGTVPTASSTVYSAKLTFKATTQVRAQAFVGGNASGALSTAIYIARTIDPTSDIPIMLVESYGKPKPCDKSTYVDAAVMIWEPVGGVAKMSSLPTLVTRAGYHVRGQSSMALAQTPYKVEFWDNANKDVDLPVMGMPADSDWALIAPYYDRTIIRNPFVYTLGKDMGLEAPRTAYAEIYVNQTTHAISDTEYEGIYWVTELIKNCKVRLDLKQLEAKDTDAAKITGGYIFKFDQAAAEEPKIACTGSNPLPGFASGGMGNFGAPSTTPTTKAVPASTTTCKMTFGGGGIGTGTGTAGTCWTDLEVVDPDDLNAEQKAWLTKYIQTFHDNLHKSPIGDYATYIDQKSFVDYLLVNELTRNVDAYVRSAYYHKDRDGKLKAGPLWDYNFALGGVGAQSPTPTSTSDPGWQYTGTGRNVNNWYPKLTGDASFMSQVKTRYKELRSSLWSDASMKSRIDSLCAPIKQAVVRDYARWPVPGVILSSTGFTGGPTAATWDGQVQVMRDFITARMAWMDANLK